LQFIIYWNSDTGADSKKTSEKDTPKKVEKKPDSKKTQWTGPLSVKICNSCVYHTVSILFLFSISHVHFIHQCIIL